MVVYRGFDCEGGEIGKKINMVMLPSMERG